MVKPLCGLPSLNGEKEIIFYIFAFIFIEIAKVKIILIL